MIEKFKLLPDQIEQIENMINNVISTVSGSDDIEIKIIDNEEWEANLTVCIDSDWKKLNFVGRKVENKEHENGE